MFKVRSTTRKCSKSSPSNINAERSNLKLPKLPKLPKQSKQSKASKASKLPKLPNPKQLKTVFSDSKSSKWKDPNANPKTSKPKEKTKIKKLNKVGAVNEVNGGNEMNEGNEGNKVRDAYDVNANELDVDTEQSKRMSKKRKLCEVSTVKKCQKTDDQFDFLEFIQICRNATTKRALVMLDLQQQLALTHKPNEDWQQAVASRRQRIILEDQIAQLGIGISVATFDEQVAPYLELYERHTNDDKTLISMFEAYVLRTQDHVSVEPTNPDVCACGSQFLESVDDALLVCNNPQCRTIKDFLDASTASLAYGDEIEWSSSSYKRMNHLSEWLNHFQARETTRVPDAFVDQVTANLPKNADRAATFMDVNLTLRAIGIRNYYDHAMQIYSRITGHDPVRLDPQVEERVRLMFLRIQDPFIKHRPADRKNFLSYPYVIFKILQLLGNVQVLPYLTLLKGKQVLRKQEEIWIKICEDVGWDFIPVPEEVAIPECIDDQDLMV